MPKTKTKTKKQHSALIRSTLAQLKKRVKAIGVERDALRAIAEDCADLADSCDDATGDIESAINTLSKYA